MTAGAASVPPANVAPVAAVTVAGMSVCHRWSYDTDDPAWAAGFDGLLADARRLVAAARQRGIAVGGLSPATPPLIGPVVLAVCDATSGEPLLLHRLDPAPWSPGQACADGADEEDLLPDGGAGVGAVRTGGPFDALAGALLLRAVTRSAGALRLASTADWAAWTPARQLVGDVFGEDPTCPFDPAVPALAG